MKHDDGAGAPLTQAERASFMAGWIRSSEAVSAEPVKSTLMLLRRALDDEEKDEEVEA